MRKTAGSVLLWAAFLMLFGCGSGSSSGPAPPVTQGHLYATNGVTSTVLRFDAAASGDVPSQGQITGLATLLQTPDFILADGIADRIFVSNFGTASILIFDHASTSAGNIPPARTIAGANTTLNGVGPLALDPGRDQLYAADGFNNRILVFNPASTVNGNVAPARSVNLGFTPRAIVLDPGNDRLFIADTSNRVSVYDNASTLNLNAIASRVIAGPATQILFPVALQLDSGGRLLVLNSSVSFNAITIYANAAAENGNIAPDTVIAGPATQFVAPVGMVLSSTGELYVADLGGTVAVFSAGASGNASPLRSLGGPNTGLQTVPGIGNLRGIALDHPR